MATVLPSSHLNCIHKLRISGARYIYGELCVYIFVWESGSARLALLFTYWAGKYGIRLSPACIHGAHVLSMLQYATVVSWAISKFVLNTFVAKLGCPWAFNHCFLLYAGRLSIKCIRSHWTLGFHFFPPGDSFPAKLSSTRVDWHDHFLPSQSTLHRQRN